MNDFSDSLRRWRAARRFSQLDLANEASISARHLSFLETGRANPSRDMVLRLGEALELPLDARNQMLTSAGFAARYEKRSWDAGDMAAIRRAVDHMLTSHMPFPGLAVDHLWSVQMANPAALALFQPFGVGIGDSLLDLMMGDQLPGVVENWPDVAHHAALRLRTESAAAGGIAAFERVIAHLEQVAPRRDVSRSPVIPTILRMGDMRLSFFATIAQFGTPEDLALDTLKIELYFPSDTATEEVFRAQAAAAPR